MNRRRFIGATSGLVLGTATRPGAAEAQTVDRIGLTTSVFRNYFKQTLPKGAEASQAFLKLADIPAFYAKRFRIQNVEFWSKHFESRDPDYLDSLKDAAAKSKSRLINLQIDDKYNLADPDEEKREASIELVKEWIDVASRLGMPSARANTGKGEVDHSIDSLKTLTAYAKSKSLILLVENHGGNSMVPANLLRILKEVDSPNLRALPDFGNYPDNETRYAGLKGLCPHAHLISAKVTVLDEERNHPEYDFAKCVRIAEKAGFKGIYSIEQWTNDKRMRLTPEAVVDWAMREIAGELKA